jgi:transcriptional regulator with PAS, ATPase and Fis domain
VPDFTDDATTRFPAERRGIRIASVNLVVVDGPSRGARAPIQAGIARIGTAPGNELKLDDATVSRVHCEIRVKHEAITLRDLGSTNGTYVDGVRLRDGDVAPGALVRVGASTFRVEMGQEPAFVDVSDAPAFGELVGTSLEMRRVYAVLERLAKTDATLLVQGETGTGKDVVARSLHAASRRAAGPLVSIDCGAIPESLFESELFGHVRGAFSGAVSDRKGVLEEASGGTLFLDEIGEMPIALQAKILRALESRTVRRVGSNAEKSIDVRIVAATNRPLARCVNDGTFREDLYYRLAVVEVQLPPLRARRDDIPVLARHFYRQLAGPNADLPQDFVAMLSQRAWPGNVRELKNFIERSVSLGFMDRASAPRLVPPQPPSSIEALVPLHLPLKDARQAWTENFEAIYLRSLLAKTNGNVTRAAEMAGVNRRFLQRMMARLGMGSADARDDE